MFNVKVKDKATNKELQITVGGGEIRTADDAKKYIEAMPGAQGGSHKGFEFISAEPVGPPEPAVHEAGPGPAGSGQ